MPRETPLAFPTLTQLRAKSLARALVVIDAFGWTREHFLADLPDKWQLSFTAHDDQLLGFAILSRKSCPHLHRLMVRADRRNHGIGSAMMVELRRRAGPEITVKVHTWNEDALRFYRRHGFVDVEPGEYTLLRYGHSGS